MGGVSSPRKLTDSIGLPFNNVPSLIKQHLGGNIAGHFYLIATSLNLPSAVALGSDDHRCCIFSRSAMNFLVFRSCLASKQIVLSLSRLCISMQSMVLSLDSILYMLLCHRIPVFYCFVHHKYRFFTPLLGNNTLTSVPPAPHVRHGLYPTQ